MICIRHWNFLASHTIIQFSHSFLGILVTKNCLSKWSLIDCKLTRSTSTTPTYSTWKECALTIGARTKPRYHGHLEQIICWWSEVGRFLLPSEEMKVKAKQAKGTQWNLKKMRSNGVYILLLVYHSIWLCLCQVCFACHEGHVFQKPLQV